MGYIRNRVQIMLDIMDQRNYLPEKWEKFVDDVKQTFGLIIRGKKNTCRCTNCDFEFVNKSKIGSKVKCPNCKNTYSLRSPQLKFYSDIDRLILLDKVGDELVYRYFEIYGSSNKENNYKFRFSIVEFGRSFPDENTEVVNERLSRCQCHIYVSHLRDSGNWRQYTRRYDFGNVGYVYPYNLKEIFEGTKYQYLDLREFVKKSGHLWFEHLMQNVANASSFEMLIKLKLYKLAFDAYYISSDGGSFNKIFGVPKDYYDFMRRNNITWRELQLLRMLKEKNISKIRYLEKFKRNNDISEIAEYTGINNLYKYLKQKRGKVDINLYKDYLDYAKRLRKNMKDRKILYPQNLKMEHDKFYSLVQITSNKKYRNKVKQRYKQLLANSFSDKDYIVMPAKSVEALEDESVQQGHCVRDYTQKYADAICDIYFMRKKECPEKSLVTIEVRNNKIYQKRIKKNELPNKKENRFLEKWQEKVLSQSCRV